MKQKLQNYEEFCQAQYKPSSCSCLATEVIFDAGHGEGFCVGNILKYAQRWGKKTDKTQKLDLYKVIHYTMILLGHIDREANAKLEKELDEYDMQMNTDKS